MKNTLKKLTQMLAVMMVAIMALGAFPLTAQANPQTVTITVDGPNPKCRHWFCNHH